MKKVSAVALLAACLFACTACGGGPAKEDDSIPLHAVSSEVSSEQVSSVQLAQSDSQQESLQTGETVFEDPFSAEFKDPAFSFHFMYPKELELVVSEGQVSLSSAEPMVLLQFNVISQGEATFKDFEAELQDTFSEVTEFTVGDKRAVRGTQHVGQGAKRNYAIDAGDGSLIIVQGVVDGLGSEEQIPMLDTIVEGLSF